MSLDLLCDSFSDGNNTRNTLAYPTTITDPDEYSSTAQYDFDFRGRRELRVRHNPASLPIRRDRNSPSPLT